MGAIRQFAFIRNLSEDTTEEQLEQIFENVGTVVARRIGIDPSTWQAWSHAFVEFDEEGEHAMMVDRQTSKISQNKLRRVMTRR